MNRLFFVSMLVLAVAFSLGCSGKTTVREEMIDTSPRQGSDEKKETVKESEEAKEEASKEEPKEESKEQPSSQLPSPGIGGGSGGGQAPATPMTPGDGNDKTEREGGKEARENYYQQNLVYPGSAPLEGPNIPDSSGFTGRTILSNDPAGKVGQWYVNKFGEKATMNKVGMGQGEQYRIVIDDKENGYKTDVLIHQIDRNNQTRILISLRDAE